MTCKSFHDLDPVYVFTFTWALLILDGLWFWDSMSAIPHLGVLFVPAKTQVPSCSWESLPIILNHFAHTSIIALTELYNFHKGKDIF